MKKKQSIRDRAAAKRREIENTKDPAEAAALREKYRPLLTKGHAILEKQAERHRQTIDEDDYDDRTEGPRERTSLLFIGLGALTGEFALGTLLLGRFGLPLEAKIPISAVVTCLTALALHAWFKQKLHNYADVEKTKKLHWRRINVPTWLAGVSGMFWLVTSFLRGSALMAVLPIIGFSKIGLTLFPCIAGAASLSLYSYLKTTDAREEELAELELEQEAFATVLGLAPTGPVVESDPGTNRHPDPLDPMAVPDDVSGEAGLPWTVVSSVLVAFLCLTGCESPVSIDTVEWSIPGLAGSRGVEQERRCHVSVDTTATVDRQGLEWTTTAVADRLLPYLQSHQCQRVGVAQFSAEGDYLARTWIDVPQLPAPLPCDTAVGVIPKEVLDAIGVPTTALREIYDTFAIQACERASHLERSSAIAKQKGFRQAIDQILKVDELVTTGFTDLISILRRSDADAKLIASLLLTDGIENRRRSEIKTLTLRPDHAVTFAVVSPAKGHRWASRGLAEELLREWKEAIPQLRLIYPGELGAGVLE